MRCVCSVTIDNIFANNVHPRTLTLILETAHVFSSPFPLSLPCERGGAAYFAAVCAKDGATGGGHGWPKPPRGMGECASPLPIRHPLQKKPLRRHGNVRTLPVLSEHYLIDRFRRKRIPIKR